jgi:heme-degrading monooxygenase HmoA
MADLPFSAREQLVPGRRYVAQATQLSLVGIGGTPTFLRAVLAIRRQLADAPGLIGYSLRAKPLACDYWTLSVWEDAASLRAFVGSPPHAQLMRSLAPVMRATAFARWEIDGGDGQPEWPAALARLAEAGTAGAAR